MSRTARNPWLVRGLEQAPLLLFALVLLVFSALAPAFRTPTNALNILVQTASTGILAVGMTYVLLTAGVDLSVGAIMFLVAAVGGKLAVAGYPLGLVLPVMILTGAACGALNGFIIARLGLLAFVVTLATRYVGRGFGLWFTETRAMNLPESFYTLGSARPLGLPMPVLLLAVVVVLGHVVLTQTAFGRHLYAVGHHAESARKAGLNPRSLLFAVYLISGACAALSAVVALSQAPAVSPTFGNQREFNAIAAAVLGGTSLFGGRGAVLPGTLLGAVLMQTIENGLTILNVDPYLYPMILGSVIFVAVLLDATRNRLLAQLNRRRIFHDDSAAPLPRTT